jgi:hypothetical protein
VTARWLTKPGQARNTRKRGCQGRNINARKKLTAIMIPHLDFELGRSGEINGNLEAFVELGLSSKLEILVNRFFCTSSRNPKTYLQRFLDVLVAITEFVLAAAKSDVRI